jgi:hypothetical protein
LGLFGRHPSSHVSRPIPHAHYSHALRPGPLIRISVVDYLQALPTQHRSPIYSALLSLCYLLLTNPCFLTLCPSHHNRPLLPGFSMNRWTLKNPPSCAPAIYPTLPCHFTDLTRQPSVVVIIIIAILYTSYTPHCTYPNNDAPGEGVVPAVHISIHCEAAVNLACCRVLYCPFLYIQIPDGVPLSPVAYLSLAILLPCFMYMLAIFLGRPCFSVLYLCSRIFWFYADT